MENNISHAGVCRFFRSDGQEITFDYGERELVYDVDNNSYIDFILGFGPVILGHANPEFKKRLIPYLDYGIHMPGYTKWHEKYLDKLLSEHQSKYLASFFKTSSESVSAAIRISSIVTGKKGIIRCGYLGWHDAVIGNSLSWHEPPFSPLRNNIREFPGIRGIGSKEPVFNWSSFDISELENLICCNKEVGIFIIDAYQVEFTNLGTIQAAIFLCHKYNLIIIFDETKTSGRISKLGLSIDAGLDVDLVVLGKSIANGAPLSILIGKKELLKFSEDARIGGTFSKELLGVYSAIVTDSIMEEEHGFFTIKTLGNNFCDLFNNIVTEIGAANLVRAQPRFNGSMFDIEFSSEIISDMKLRKKLPCFLADSGILLLQAHPSFICLDYQLIDWGKLHCKLLSGMQNWIDSV